MMRKAAHRAALWTGLAIASIALLLQWYSGAWRAGWAASADSPAHLVSSLLVREYLTSGLLEGRAPSEFAADYYARFPKVAIGHWPPLFHGTLGLWLTLVPPQPGWILGLQALLAGVLAGLTVLLGSVTLGLRSAVPAGFLVMASPAIVLYSRILMADMLVAVCVTAALFSFALYWKRPSWRAATVFGLCASAALLTKPNGLMLAPAPLLCVLATRRWSLLKERSFWWPAVIVLALYGPWHFAFSQDIADGYRVPRSLFTWLVTTPAINAMLLARVLGVAGTLLAAYGMWRVRRRVGQSVTSGVVLCSAVVGAYLLHSLLLPTNGYRHFVSLAPALALLAAWGGQSALRRLGGRKAMLCAWAFPLAVLPFAGLRMEPSGVRETVTQLLRNDSLDQRWLVTGRSKLEGDVIAEAALRNPPGRLTVYRGSKLFERSGWSMRSVRLIVYSPDEASDLIERCGIDIVILGRGSPLVVAEAVGRDAARWKQVRTPLSSATALVFERVGPPRRDLGPPIVQKP